MCGRIQRKRAVEQRKRRRTSTSRSCASMPMAVHVAVDDQPIRRRALERERRLPVPAVALGERQRRAAGIDRRAVAGERIVRALEDDAAGLIENHAAPAPVVVVELRRPDLRRRPTAARRSRSRRARDLGLPPPPTCQKLQLMYAYIPRRYAPKTICAASAMRWPRRRPQRAAAPATRARGDCAGTDRPGAARRARAGTAARTIRWNETSFRPMS